MESTQRESKFDLLSHPETKQHNNAIQKNKVRVSLNNLKVPSATDVFQSRATCQRRK